MGTLLGCIADDFTGATDIAGLLARSGVDVSLRIGVPDTLPTKSSVFEVIALKSRTAPVAEAVADALEALDWLRTAGATRFFWKYCSTFDSTPDGNIGPVAEALLDALGSDRTIYCPAFPENGRSVYMGHLFVGRELLNESAMKDHPLTPMRDSSLPRLLAPQVSRKVGLCDHRTVAKGPEAITEDLRVKHADDITHVVIDAVTEDDLSAISTACHGLPLLTGGSALALNLPALYRAGGLLTARGGTRRTPHIGDGAVILSGSCSAMTRAQVQEVVARGAPAFRLDPLMLVEDGADPALAWLAEQDLRRAPIVYATATPDAVRAAQDTLGGDVAGAIVEEALARCARAARDAGARRFVVAGGETSGAVTRALGCDRLEIGKEIAPGVPWTFATSGGVDIALALKSGNFGAESFFSDALAQLESA